MKIDGNELAIEQNELDWEGRHAEAMAIKREFLEAGCGRAVITALPKQGLLSPRQLL